MIIATLLLLPLLPVLLSTTESTTGPTTGPTTGAAPDARDTDGDGLSDIHEVHKYGTDPSKRDSDGDGIPDGDWRERREYAYTVRSIVHVMRPVTVEFLNDDYQDVRVLDETDVHVELEVIHYPLNTIAEIEVKGAKKPKGLKHWTEPGPSSNATPKLGRTIRKALKADGVDVGELDTKEGVVSAARWLLAHAEYHDGFSSFITGFDEKGRPYIPEELQERAERGTGENGWSVEDQWDREVLAAQMFETKSRGSCTSSAIYMSGCLRAIGVPTRTVLCIPIIDASDESEWRLVDVGLTHNGVRQAVHSALDGGRNAWTSHTFNEVWVDGRWHRLNYSKIDQNILDETFLGLMTHVATFHDWADARMPETVGRRQSIGPTTDVFGHRNPYSTIALRDEFGVHCSVENPTITAVTPNVVALHWTDSGQLPEDIRDSCVERGRFGLIAEVLIPSGRKLASFMGEADLRVWLTAEGHDRIGTSFDAGCWWFKTDRAFVYLPFGRADRASLVEGVTYAVAARNDKGGFGWALDLEVRRD